MASGKKKKINKNSTVDYIPDVDENFAFIAGYTSGGFPFGITWDEVEAFDAMHGEDNNKHGDNNDLPFN